MVWGPGELSQSAEFMWRTGHHSLSTMPSNLVATATDISGKNKMIKERKAWITGRIWKSWSAVSEGKGVKLPKQTGKSHKRLPS